SRPTATASHTTPADELCTDEIKSNPRWVCLTSAVFAGGKLTVKYHPEYAGSTPDIHHGFHVHLYGSDGKNPPDYTMGTQVPKSQQGSYYWGDQEPAILNATDSKAIVRYPKVCARIAVASHGLVHDKKGGFKTGNSVPTTRPSPR